MLLYEYVLECIVYADGDEEEGEKITVKVQSGDRRSRVEYKITKVRIRSYIFSCLESLKIFFNSFILLNFV